MKRLSALAAALFTATLTLSGQYYNEGQDPFSIRWNRIDGAAYRLIYPENRAGDAYYVSSLLDTAWRPLHYGYSHTTARIPVILHGRNLSSNGVVSWAPRRAELIAAPPTETFAVPWLKQLALHEYRHAVQIGNLDRGFVRLAGYLVGQQAVGAASFFLPKWYLEGDAVLAETAMSSFGRALQPDFTLEYRAYLAEGGIDRFRLDKWFCGSYKDFVPDHYHLGYQLTNYSYRTYGPEFWETVTDYVARHPYFLLPHRIAYKRFYSTDERKLFRGAFGELETLWSVLPSPPDNTVPIRTPTTSFTRYSHPIFLERDAILAVKYDLDRYYRLVIADRRTGDEQVFVRTGNISSRPAVRNGAVFWTEYRPSLFWEQMNRSVVRTARLDRPRRAATAPLRGNHFYPTPLDGDRIATVEYSTAEGRYFLHLFTDPTWETDTVLALPAEVSVHGLAWEPVTELLAAILLSEEGMFLARIDPSDPDPVRPLTPPSMVSINHLTAGDGKLYFNSIRSGKDEAHCFDPATGKEYQLTRSRFGSVMPSVHPAGGETVQATFSGQGYLLSSLPLPPPDSLREWKPDRLPVNRVNAPLAGWNLPDMDTLAFSREPDGEKTPRRYRKGTHLFNIHSWAPMSYDAFETADERELHLKLGATVLSQNDLSNTEAFLSYGYVNDMSWWRGGLRFYALAPKFEINAEYGGGTRLMMAGGSVPGATMEEIYRSGALDKKFFSLEAKAYLPFNFSSGGWLRYLTPLVSLTHYNTLIYRPESGSTNIGYQKVESSVAYTRQTRMGYRDLLPRWGYSLRAIWAGAPFEKDFGQIYALYGNFYLPGPALHHSFRLRMLGQYQKKGDFNFRSVILFPRGCYYYFTPEKQGTLTLDYVFPLAYPDWGIPGIVYFKRVSLDLYGGVSRYRPLHYGGYGSSWSYGGEVTVDAHPLRMSNIDLTFKFSAYKTGDYGSPETNFSVSVNF